MLRIEVETGATVFRLIGRMQSDHIDELKRLMQDATPAIVLDMAEVTIVDRDVIRFLVACQEAGVGLRNCPPYIQEWMRQEQMEETQ